MYDSNHLKQNNMTQVFADNSISLVTEEISPRKKYRFLTGETGCGSDAH